jgi:transcription elongation GreA/GreB family factor
VDKEKMINIKKKALIKFLEILRASAVSIERQINQTRQAAIEAPSRMQSRHDSSRQELSYQVDQLTRRLSEIYHNIEILERFKAPISSEITVGSLIQLKEEDGRDLCCFIVPGGSGNIIETDKWEITVISPQAPLSKLLQGGKAGDSVSLGSRRLHIIAVF